MRPKKSLFGFVHTAGPNTALIKSSGRRDVRVVIGGRMLAIPIIQRVDALSLELRTITVHTTRGTTINGVGVDVTSCCQVKIQGWSTLPEGAEGRDDHPATQTNAGGDLHMDYSAIRLAAQHFIGRSDSEIEDAIQKTVSGHQRAIIGVLTVEQLYRDRAAFSRRVLDLCFKDMRNMGLTVVSYTVAEITDELGYIEALGVTQTETVKREAKEGAAIHRSAALSRKAKEEAEAHLRVNSEEERKIESDRLRSIRQAEAQQRIDRAVAVQQKAYAISAAEQDALLLVQKQKAKAAEAEAELEVERQRVDRERLIKQQKINVEADAKLYQTQKEAESIRVSAAAEAERIRLVGNAEADAIRAKGLAEIKTLKDRVSVWNECGNQAALLERIIEILPDVAAKIAEPLAKTEKMVFIGSGGTGGSGGPAQFTREMERIVAEVPETVNALTGFDLRKGIADLMEGGTLQNGSLGHSVVQGAAEGTANVLTEKMLKK